MQEKFWKGVGVKKVKELGLDDLFTVKGFHRDPDICVKKVIEASLNRLSPQLGDILTRLSVLRGIFDLDLGLAVTAEATEAELRHLARLSLLQEFRPEEGKPRRFQFLPLISMVVRDRANSEVLATAHQSPLDYFLAHSLPQPWESLDELTEYLEAFYHAGELKQWQLAYDILNKDRGGEGKNKLVDDFLNLQGFNQQRARLYERVIERSDKEKRCYGNSHCHLGNCYDSLGQYQEAIDHHRRSLEISKEIGDRRGEAISLGNSGNCYNSLGRYQEAIDHHRRSLEIKKEIGDRRGEAISLGNLGLCYKNLGRYPEAIDHHRQHHEISKEIGDRRGEAISLGNSGNCYDSLGRYEEAIDHYRRSLEIKKEIGDRQGVAISLHNIGNTLIELENYSEAETKIQESLVISQAIKYKNLIAESFKFLAEIAHKTNRRDIALGHCQASLVIARELGIPLVKDCEKLLAKPQENMEEND
jgi:tetratricopeptide (TPR) repeat protein